MHKAEFITATPQAAWHVINNMRVADRRECEALGFTAEEAVTEGWSRSTQAHMVAVNDRPAIVFGVTPACVLGQEGIPWLLATDDMAKVPRQFARQSRGCLEQMLSSYKVLYNMTSVDNELSIRWLEWLGFQFGAPVPVGFLGQLFVPFWIRRDH